MHDDSIGDPFPRFTFTITIDGQEADAVASVVGHVLDVHLLPDLAEDHDTVRIGLNVESADGISPTWMETCAPPVTLPIGRDDN